MKTRRTLVDVLAEKNGYATNGDASTLITTHTIHFREESTDSDPQDVYETMRTYTPMLPMTEAAILFAALTAFDQERKLYDAWDVYHVTLSLDTQPSYRRFLAANEGLQVLSTCAPDSKNKTLTYELYGPRQAIRSMLHTLWSCGIVASMTTEPCTLNSSSDTSSTKRRRLSESPTTGLNHSSSEQQMDLTHSSASTQETKETTRAASSSNTRKKCSKKLQKISGLSSSTNYHTYSTGKSQTSGSQKRGTQNGRSQRSSRRSKQTKKPTHTGSNAS